MRRILFFITLLFTGGIIIGLVIQYNLFIFLLGLVFIFSLSIYRFLKGRKISCLLCLLVFSIGVFCSSYRIYSLENKFKDFIGQNITIIGQIDQDISQQNKMSSFNIYVNSIEANGKTYLYRCKIRVIDYKNYSNYVIPFNTVRLSGDFDNRQLYNNIGLFNNKKYLQKEGICGVIIADYQSGIVSYKCSDRLIKQTSYAIKTSIEDRFKDYVSDTSFQILKGILFGDISGIEEDQYKTFQDCGTIHIFAVSGYNIWLLYFVLFNLFFFLKHNLKIKTIIIILLLCLYTIMSGGSPSVVRAFIMICIILVGKLLKKETDPLTSLALAAILILLFNPLQILDIGFQLSFICIISIILLLPVLKKIKMPVHNRVVDAVLMTLSIQIGILPVTLYYFNSFPVFSILANLIIVPLVSILTILGIVICILSFTWASAAAITGLIIDFICSNVLDITNIISKIPYSNLNIITPNIIVIFLYYLVVGAIFKLIVIKDRYKRAVNYLVIVSLISYTIYGLIPTDLQISFIDVGQGDSILISTPDRKHILIDGGGKLQNSYSSIDIGQDIVKPYLYKHGINKLDMVISTHGHEDHINGLISLMDSIRIDKFIKSQYNSFQGYDKVNKRFVLDKSKIINTGEGDIIQAGKYVRLYVLNPGVGMYDENDSSIVIKLEYKNFSALFTGDISTNIEKKLTSYDIKSDVIKIPHHGSITSLDNDFINKVNPKIAAICVGQNNYGHPSQITINKIVEKKIKLYRTDKSGEIIITTDGKNIRIKTAS